jgi:hypothetical protein
MRSRPWETAGSAEAGCQEVVRGPLLDGAAGGGHGSHGFESRGRQFARQGESCRIAGLNTMYYNVPVFNMIIE